MKKFLTLLVIVIVLPLATTLISNANTVHKENNNINVIKQCNKWKIKQFNNSDGSINWNAVQNNFENQINSNQFTPNQFTPEQKTYLKKQSAAQTQTFAQANITDAPTFNAYLKNTNKSYKIYYDDVSKAGKNISDQINFEYFSHNKVDLKLDGSNTYQDVANVLSAKIKSEYPDANIVITLSDASLASKTLFDDSREQSIAQFVKDKITTTLNVQIDEQKPEIATIQLKNLQLTKVSDQKWLTDAVASYFDISNAQDLDLRLEDTRQTAFNKLLNKVKFRFPNYDQQIKLSLTNQSAANQNFFNPDMINYVLNQDAWIGVNVTTSSFNKNLDLYFNFDLNDLEMNEIIDSTFLTDGQINSQNLGLTTDDTFQNVVDKLNTRLFNLDKTKNYKAVLVDPSQAATTLDQQYNPENPPTEYHVNVDFQMKLGNKIENLGSSNLNLVNVQLGENAKKVKAKYDQFNQLMNKLNDISTELNDLSITAAFAASAMWATAWFFGITTSPAIALTAASVVIGIASSILSVDVDTAKKQLSASWGIANAILQINFLAIGVCYGLYSIFDGLISELTATSWAGLGFILTVITTLTEIVPTVQLIEKWFH